MLSVWLTVLLFTLVGAEVKIIPGQTCRAIETVGDTLQIEALESFLLTYNLNSDLPTEFLQRYKEKNDEMGEFCLAELNLRINDSLSRYSLEISHYQDEQFMLEVYLKDPEFQGRGKRASGAVIFAILVSISNFAATGYNLFSTNYQIGTKIIAHG